MNNKRQALLRAIFAAAPREQIERWRETWIQDKKALDRVYAEAKRRDEHRAN